MNLFLGEGVGAAMAAAAVVRWERFMLVEIFSIVLFAGSLKRACCLFAEFGLWIVFSEVD